MQSIKVKCELASELSTITWKPCCIKYCRHTVKVKTNSLYHRPKRSSNKVQIWQAKLEFGKKTNVTSLWWIIVTWVQCSTVICNVLGVKTVTTNAFSFFCEHLTVPVTSIHVIVVKPAKLMLSSTASHLSLIHIWRCRRIERCRSRWSPYH